MPKVTLIDCLVDMHRGAIPPGEVIDVDELAAERLIAGGVAVRGVVAQRPARPQPPAEPPGVQVRPAATDQSTSNETSNETGSETDGQPDDSDQLDSADDGQTGAHRPRPKKKAARKRPRQDD